MDNRPERKTEEVRGMKFYNPYQFIPFKSPENLKPYEKIEDGTTEFVRHDRWDKDSYSGRIICKLTTISPLVVGAKQEAGVKEDKSKGIKGSPGVVHPYRDGQALPANSLRGMISSVAEAISNSAMRVLSNSDTHTYSVYKNKKRCPVGSLYDSIHQIDKNLLPWNGNQGRDSLTPAEALFGVVEENIEEQARNLASRLRFYDASAEKEITLEPYPYQLLKILDSPSPPPSPPSPSMYFRTKGGAYISKSNLNLDNEDHRPNGRKRYLAHPDWEKKIKDENGKEKNKWETQHETDNIHQKLKCEPIPANECFWFHIDFENLSKDELNLLRKAITPSENFQHQLGLGKPLGLGQITIKESALFIIDRVEARYSLNGLFDKHYREWWGEGNIPLAIYPKEAEFSQTPAKTGADMECKYVDPGALKRLSQIGSLESYEKDSKNRYIPVCYPFTGSEKYNEKKGYEWFVKNDENENNKPKLCQRLREILLGKQLSPLDSNTDKPKITSPNLPNKKIIKIKICALSSQWKIKIVMDDIVNAIEQQYSEFSVQEVSSEDNKIKDNEIIVKISFSNFAILSRAEARLPLKVISNNETFDLKLQILDK